MTREEALNELGVNFNDKELGFINNIQLVSEIFKEHEAQLKAKDEEIESIKQDNYDLKQIIFKKDCELQMEKDY